jgi:hypothetical protein
MFLERASRTEGGGKTWPASLFVFLFDVAPVPALTGFGGKRIAIETKSSLTGEQRERGKEVSFPADIYVLGLILNELFTSQVQQGAGFRRIGEVSSDHVFLDALVDEMIRQDPAKRPV